MCMHPGSSGNDGHPNRASTARTGVASDDDQQQPTDRSDVGEGQTRGLGNPEKYVNIDTVL